MTLAATYTTQNTTIENTRYLEDIRSWIFNHLDAKHSLTGLAAQAGVSPSWLQRSFKKTFGYSVFTYIRYERLLRAQKQLEVTSMTIKTISAEAGYSSVPAFTAAFSLAFGVTPARFRREIK
jgi:AraC-like DNA-binding protein